MELRIRLPEAARDALGRLALRERRDPSAQAEWIVLTDLERRGLFQPTRDTAERAGSASR